MNEIIERVAAAAGIDKDMAARAVEIILELVRDHGPRDKVNELFALLPGVEPPGEPASGGFLSGLGFGGAMGAMGALNKLTEAGLSMKQIETSGKEILAYSREHAGDELVREVIGSIPGLSQFA